MGVLGKFQRCFNNVSTFIEFITKIFCRGEGLGCVKVLSLFCNEIRFHLCPTRMFSKNNAKFVI